MLGKYWKDHKYVVEIKNFGGKYCLLENFSNIEKFRENVWKYKNFKMYENGENTLHKWNKFRKLLKKKLKM
jgi:hypothetical protein